jgi:ubiquitin carboxyl-terminal hydrolase 5/13
VKGDDEEKKKTPVFQEGVKPTGFKALIGKGHEEFSTMRQQDSEEFLTYLLSVLRRYAHSHPTSEGKEPTEIFAFGMEQRLQCGECKGVRYRVDGMDVVSVPVPAKEKGKDAAEGKTEWEEVRLEECLDGLTGAEALEYGCPRCGKGVIAIK